MKNIIEIKDKIKNFDRIIKVSSDKSISIRSVLLASQAIGKSNLYNLLESEDVINSLKAIKKLGIKYKKIKNCYRIYGFGLSGYKLKKKINLNAGNSGTLARLILGLLININKEVTIKGDKSLSKRDFSRITIPLKKFGVNIKSKNKSLPVKISGSDFLRPINYVENLGSAQCKSAIMLAALKAPGITRIKAKKSRNHTEVLFKSLNIPIKIQKKKSYDYIEVKGITGFNGFDYVIPGDISSSSFFIVLTLLANKSKLMIQNINVNNTRIGIIKILNKMGAKIRFKDKKNYRGETLANILVNSSSNLKGINCPENLNSSAIDEFLLIFLVAAKANGISNFRNLGELNKKESPRLDIAINFLRDIGIKVQRNKDNVKIYGNPKLELNNKFIVKNFRKDHRIFMMSCIAALVLGGNFNIHDVDSINTSFPNFLKILSNLGAKIKWKD